MITTVAPDTWQDLQTQVARTLAECGFTTATEQVIQLVRGQAEIDVLAQESIRGRKYLIFCECKHWQSSVPQTVIHSFRTIVADGGANKGYIISLRGFQSGAITAAELTNIELVSWDQFQAAFEESWINNYFIPMVTERLDPLMTFTEPLYPNWVDLLPDDEKRAFFALVKEHLALGVLAMQFSSYSRILRAKELPPLPLIKLFSGDELYKQLPKSVLEATGYRELLDAMLDHGERGIVDFRALRDRNGQTGGE